MDSKMGPTKRSCVQLTIKHFQRIVVKCQHSIHTLKLWKLLIRGIKFIFAPQPWPNRHHRTNNSFSSAKQATRTLPCPDHAIKAPVWGTVKVGRRTAIWQQRQRPCTLSVPLRCRGGLSYRTSDASDRGINPWKWFSFNGSLGLG